MNKKDISELKRRLRTDKHNISCIRGCYVNDSHAMVSEFNPAIYLLPEEEMENYLSIFKKTLSGTPGKNLIDISFGTNQVADSEQHRLLTALRTSALKDDAAVSEFFKKTMESLDYKGSYVILLMTDTYDVPSKTTDEFGNDEWSNDVFSYIMCSICPIKSSKAQLSYEAKEKTLHNRNGGSVITAPELGFIFPAFEERKANIYGALYYNRDTTENHKEYSDVVFDTQIPLPAAVQRETFGTVIEQSISDTCSYDVVQSVHEQLNDMILAHEESKEPETLTVDRSDVRAMLASSGVPEDKLETFEQKYESEFGKETRLLPQNIINTRQFELKMPDVIIRVNNEHSDAVTTQVIDGVKYVMVRADQGVEVNGISINI